MSIDAGQTVGELVAERPSRARVFEQVGLDYCCGGGRPLAQACAANGLDLADVTARLETLDDVTPREGEQDWRAEALVALCDHIVTRHHAFARSELPRLEGFMERVVRAHGARHSELGDVQAVLETIAEELSAHMGIEEQVLFPACKRLEREGESGFWSLAVPIEKLEADHSDTGDALARLRALTDAFTPPPDACNTYRALYDGLHALEQDLHLHIHEENNILFPRALELEACTQG
ncbi:MAG: iron-sulfur cluster repair di-iron protein [Gaiellales bacterium]